MDETARSAQLDALFRAFCAMVRDGEQPDDAEASIFAGCRDEALTRETRARFDEFVKSEQLLGDPPPLSRPGRAWYQGPRPTGRYWPAMAHLLEEDGWDKDAEIANVDHSSTEIVAQLEHPGVSTFRRYGLVLGHVQAGKTTSFTSVISKAADERYRLFIVLSGIHNGLRYQTQTRLEQFLHAPNPNDWFRLTTQEQDFIAPADTDAYFAQHGTRMLAVVKKNGPRLRRLKRWLKGVNGALLASCPVLIIDDEADQATINTAGGDAAASVINRLVREIIDLCPRVCYVGYTATPFANLLVNPAPDTADLYPRDFIYDLGRPDGHFGPDALFGRGRIRGEEDGPDVDGYPMVRVVDDEDVEAVCPPSPRDRFDFQPGVPPSLRQAVRYFWIATAARRVRGTGSRHSSMLVHTTVHPIVHLRMKRELERERSQHLHALGAGAPDLERELANLWDAELDIIDAADFGEARVPWEELRPHLEEVVASTIVVTDNSSSDTRLAYGSDPLVVVAVGGNTLSRGLTLEGLVTSYFVRRALAYDTLLQMGRWFGYRHGYADLPRIWTTTQLEEWFRDIATVEAEIRSDIARYRDQHLTPLEFAVRIRTHPKLAVTAASKMRHAVPASLSYEGRRIQTIQFRQQDFAWLESNLRATRTLIGAALARGATDRPSRVQGNVRVIDGVASDLICAFLTEYQFQTGGHELDASLITRYIREQSRQDGAPLSLWNVIVMSTEHRELGSIDLGLPSRLGLMRRSRYAPHGRPALADVADIKALMSRIDSVLDLDMSRADAEALFDGETGRRDGLALAIRRRSELIPGRDALIIYPVSRESPPLHESRDRLSLGAVEDVVGIALVFPPARVAEEYVQVSLAGFAEVVDPLELEEAEALLEDERGAVEDGEEDAEESGNVPLAT